jgi:hypothetical protein
MSGNAEESTKKCPPSTQCFTWKVDIFVYGRRCEIRTRDQRIKSPFALPAHTGNSLRNRRNPRSKTRGGYQNNAHQRERQRAGLGYDLKRERAA